MNRLSIGHIITDKVYAIGVLNGKELVALPMLHLDGTEANAMLKCGLAVLLHYVLNNDLSDETEVITSTTKLISCMKLGDTYEDNAVHILREFIRQIYNTKFKKKRKKISFKYVSKDKNEAYQREPRPDNRTGTVEDKVSTQAN